MKTGDGDDMTGSELWGELGTLPAQPMRASLYHDHRQDTDGPDVTEMRMQISKARVMTATVCLVSYYVLFQYRA